MVFSQKPTRRSTGSSNTHHPLIYNIYIYIYIYNIYIYTYIYIYIYIWVGGQTTDPLPEAPCSVSCFLFFSFRFCFLRSCPGSGALGHQAGTRKKNMFLAQPSFPPAVGANFWSRFRFVGRQGRKICCPPSGSFRENTARFFSVPSLGAMEPFLVWLGGLVPTLEHPFLFGLEGNRFVFGWEGSEP